MLFFRFVVESIRNAITNECEELALNEFAYSDFQVLLDVAALNGIIHHTQIFEINQLVSVSVRVMFFYKV
jgi:hypothetical protein